MNKKGFILHWILFGFLAALAVFFVSSFDFNVGAHKGAWPLSFVHAHLDAERNLLKIDQTAFNVASEAFGESMSTGFSEACGQHLSFPVWNTPEQFCDINIREDFLQRVKGPLQEKIGITYESIQLIKNDLVAK